MSEWKETTLGDIINFRRGHDLPKTEMKEGKIPVVGSNGIIGFHDKSTTKAPCVSIGRSGNVGTPLIINQDCWAHNTTLYIDDFKGNDPYYIFYHLGTLNLKDYGGGSAVPTLNRNHIHPIPTKIPPLPEQKAIVHILGTLDEKIELNRKMNQTLEAMAQALFKSWFVDFDPVIDNAVQAGNVIPEELQARAEKRRRVIAGTVIANPDEGGMKQSPDVIAPARRGGSKEAPIAIGGPKQSLKPLLHTNPSLAAQFPASFVFNETLGKWIPEGWRSEQVEHVLNRLKVSSRFKKEDLIPFGKVPVYEQGVNILMGYHNGGPDIKASADDPAFIFGDHTCVMKLGMTPFSISANVIALKGNIRNTIWTYFSLLGVQSFEEYRRHWMELAVKNITMAPKDICDSFEFKVKDFLLKQVEIQNEIETLTQLRDRLLPELISGRVRVKREDILEQELAVATDSKVHYNSKP